MLDLHVHGMAHGQYSHCPDSLKRFIYNAMEKGIGVIGFSEHDWYLDRIDFNLLREMNNATSRIDIRSGLEVDHRPGYHSEIQEMLAPYFFDYLIGSIHEIDGWLFDHPDFAEEFNNWNIDTLYETYFEAVEDLVASGIYDVIGHMDLIKIYGHRPSRKIDAFVASVLDLARKKNMTVEVNTSGAYKPVREIYPSRRVLEMCKELGVWVTLGSDAHHPEHVGRNIASAIELLVEIGFREVVSFSGRKPVFHTLE